MASKSNLLNPILVLVFLCSQWTCTFKKQKDLGLWQSADSLERYEVCQVDGAAKDFCLSMGEQGEVVWAAKGQAKLWLKYDNQLNIDAWKMAKLTLVNPSTPVIRLSFFKQSIELQKSEGSPGEIFYLGRVPEISLGTQVSKSWPRFDCVAKGISHLHLHADAQTKGLGDCAKFQFIKDSSDSLASRAHSNSTLKKVRVLAVNGRSTPNSEGLRTPLCLTVRENNINFSECSIDEEIDSKQIFTLTQEYDRIRIHHGDKVMGLINDAKITDVQDFRWSYKMLASTINLKTSDSLRLTADFPLDRVSPDRQFTFIAFKDQSMGIKNKHYRCLGFGENGRLAVHFTKFTHEELLNCARLSYEPVIGFE